MQHEEALAAAAVSATCVDAPLPALLRLLALLPVQAPLCEVVEGVHALEERQAPPQQIQPLVHGRSLVT